MHLGSYNEILHVAHKSVEEIWYEPIEIQEKVDGSQISFMEDPETGELLIRSKGKQIFEDDPGAKMFNSAVASIKSRADLLVPGHIWRGEYLQKPKHNSLKYDRIPNGHIVIFDIEMGMGNYANPDDRAAAAEFMGYEVVPTLFYGQCPIIYQQDKKALKDFFEMESFLGGAKIEGIVVKCYTKTNRGKPLMAKLVSEAFKEVHETEWKKTNPVKKDTIESLIEKYRTEPRWLKSIQHLRDNGVLDNSPRDIGPILKEISADIKKEEEDAIKQALFDWAFPSISRGVTRGFPEFYKDYLLNEG